MTASAPTPSFNKEGLPLAPEPARLSVREAYYHLVNIEEHPEALPLAYDVVVHRLAASAATWPDLASALERPTDAIERLTVLTERLVALRERFAHPWRSEQAEVRRRLLLQYFVQYMPTALVDGSWLQGGVRVATAHTAAGSALTGLYLHQVRAFVHEPARHFLADYRSVYERLGAPLEDVASHSFAQRTDLLESSFPLPIFLLAVAQFTRSFTAEIVGLNLAWQFLDLSAFGPDLVRDVCDAYGLPLHGMHREDPGHRQTGRDMAHATASRLLKDAGELRMSEVWASLVRGAAAGVQIWTEWFEQAQGAAPAGSPDPRQEMIDLLWRKAPHAIGYHGSRTLGARPIDEQLATQRFDGPALLDALAASPWVKARQPDKSALLKRLIGFGGPMLSVFSPVEQQIIERWIESLPVENDAPPLASPRPTVPQMQYVEGRRWDRAALRRRSENLYGRCSVRELYHYLVNVELHPDILPVAERFACDRLERSMAALSTGERAIPSRRYDPAALEAWVYAKHREQIDSYRPPAVRPEAPKDAFIEATVQLAPLILIDGGWLQGMASPALVHTTVGRMLLHVFVEELGEGRAEEHHANIYRDLLAAMGETAPSVETWEFARWARLQDSSFDAPTLWLSISCFPRHFLPEILGLNLAVELAGVGGPYMEARDTLRRFRYPTLFVDVHNAADNVTAGHAAWAMNAVKRYMDDVAERDGPHNVDRVWHRVWSGVRAPLPQIGRVKLIAHRLRQRFFGQDSRLVPLIFPS